MKEIKTTNNGDTAIGMIKCPKCSQETLQYKQQGRKVVYTCMNPKCYFEHEKNMTRGSAGGTLLVIAVVALLALAVMKGYGVA